MSVGFEGKRALVTGAGAGIGRALAKRLVELGAEVFALSRTESHLNSLKEECHHINTICVDLSNWSATREEVEKVLPIHALVNNAGVAIVAPVLEATPEDFDIMFSINVKAAINVTQVVAKDLISKNLPGSIVNVSSQASMVALQNHMLYGSSKSAQDMVTKSFANELGPNGIRVNSVNPTVVLTEMAKVGWSDPKKAKQMKDQIPLRRFAEVDEVVNPIVFLLSDQSSMINGHHLAIDGGFLAA